MSVLAVGYVRCVSLSLLCFPPILSSLDSDGGPHRPELLWREGVVLSRPQTGPSSLASSRGLCRKDRLGASSAGLSQEAAFTDSDYAQRAIRLAWGGLSQPRQGLLIPMNWPLVPQLPEHFPLRENVFSLFRF